MPLFLEYALVALIATGGTAPSSTGATLTAEAITQPNGGTMLAETTHIQKKGHKSTAQKSARKHNKGKKKKGGEEKKP